MSKEAYLHLAVFGVGPIYIAGIFTLAAIASILNYLGFASGGDITNSGLLLVQANWWLLALPFVYWIALSVLMKHTEERWLENKFGAEYTRYATHVNRAFPRPPRKTKTRHKS
ncbi:protein-S-isoprenylcysteine O-methyltransferase Ste14 [Trueperella bonasi]|uniref:Protein-S-isoprenylcysteine O-methyltransferase Ste14 n=1 Tax=Trueperella bonasi TaxID=312286 RepID=A0ABT9NHS1_9ACTO|nr:hypothetical protein [Trueperella bonasi]MDP9806894.1 protein-S-isoprenylcysteine O-methyltransferase Ste14 [Trueperella bonasi]